MVDGDDFKINISITSMETSFTLSWVNAFKVVNFNPENIAPITIKSTNAQPITTTTTITTTTVNTNCSAYEGKKGGKVKVNIYNSEGECFDLSINGVAVPQQTANATLYLDYGKKDLSFKFASGVVLEEKFTLFDTWAETTFRLKKNNKGEYSLNHDLTALVLNDNGNTTAGPRWEEIYSSDKQRQEIDLNSIKESNGVTSATVRTVYLEKVMYGNVYRTDLVVTFRFEIMCGSTKPIRVLHIRAVEGGQNVIHEDASTGGWQTSGMSEMENALKHVCGQ